MARQIALLALAFFAAATASHASAVDICGTPLENTMANGGVIATNPKNATDAYVCCNQCSAQPDCVAFVEGGKPDEPTCQLLSYVYSLPSTPSILLPKGYMYTTVFVEGREAANWAKCGDKNGFKGCNSGFYCKPWDKNYYQCVAKPASQCKVETNIDYFGSDIKRVTGLTPGACCDECTNTPGCNAYTFVNDAPDGRQCYLKSFIGEKKPNAGVISGIIAK